MGTYITIPKTAESRISIKLDLVDRMMREVHVLAAETDDQAVIDALIFSAIPLLTRTSTHLHAYITGRNAAVRSDARGEPVAGIIMLNGRAVVIREDVEASALYTKISEEVLYHGRP